MSGVAGRVAEVVESLVGSLPLRLEAWDGSSAGPVEGPGVRLASPDALRRLLWNPDELGAGQAYVTGALEVDGPLEDVLRVLRSVADEQGLPTIKLSRKQIRPLVGILREAGVVGSRLPDPAIQIPPRGRNGPRGHGDAGLLALLPVEACRLVLGEQVVGSAGYVTGAALDGGETDAYRLEDAQRDKLDLVCRKLGLDARPGLRLLDAGCGWGALAVHAAQRYGAQVTGLTTSVEQRVHVEETVHALGLQEQVVVRLMEPGEVDDGPYDAVAALEKSEQAGQDAFAPLVAAAVANAAEHTRVLVQQVTRAPGHRPDGGAFVEGFVAPERTLRSLAQVVAVLEDAGLEVRDVHGLREHQLWTLRAWRRRFDAHRDELVAHLGDERVRGWDVYLAAAIVAAEQGRIGVDQVLAVRRGSAFDLPAVRTW